MDMDKMNLIAAKHFKSPYLDIHKVEVTNIYLLDCPLRNIIVRTEQLKDDFSDDITTIDCCYSLGGLFLGGLTMLKDNFLYNINTFEKAKPSHNVASIGFSESETKWYGWSHRAIYGFTIGSEVKRGDCAYKPINFKNFIKYYLEFFDVTLIDKEPIFSETTPDNKRYSKVLNKYHKSFDEYGNPTVIIYYDKHTYNKTDDKLFKYSHSERNQYTAYLPLSWGKGEWVAETLEDAKQMAIDFACGVS